jgi:hypothetical protein
MKPHSPILLCIVILLSVAISIPRGEAAQAGQKAGQVSRAIPDVGIARGQQQLTASLKTVVDWGDVVHTNEGGRARVSLDDGSVLNVGSSSSLTVTQHNAAAQQTQIELTYGRMRSQVVKQSKPNAKFEIHTAAGVAGIVGTDFFLSYLNGLFRVIVYDGHVRFCNLDGQCVDVFAGMTATIRNGHQPPDQPTSATSAELTEAANTTLVGVGEGLEQASHTSPWVWLGVVGMVVAPAVAVPLTMRNSPSPTGQPIGIKKCPPTGQVCP